MDDERVPLPTRASSSGALPTQRRRRRRTFYYILVGLIVEGCLMLLIVRGRCQQRDEDGTGTAISPSGPYYDSTSSTTLFEEEKKAAMTTTKAKTPPPPEVELLMASVVGARLRSNNNHRNGAVHDPDPEHPDEEAPPLSTAQLPQPPGTVQRQQHEQQRAVTAPAPAAAVSSAASTTTPSSNPRTTTTTSILRTQTDGQSSEPDNFSSFFYSPARLDRAGAALQDMLVALSYGFANNITYRGACYERRLKEDAFTVQPKAHPQDANQWDKDSLIEVLGLHDVLVFACPPRRRADTLILRPGLYRNDNTSRNVVNPDFLHWVRSKSKTVGSATAAAAESAASTTTTLSLSAVVHVRRGDIDPCHAYRFRYLPNSYFVDVVHQFVPDHVPVTIFSESASFEPFDDLVEALQQPSTAETNATADGGGMKRRNVTLLLDTDPVDVWEAMLGATHIVMSFSSFSYVPALLNHHGINATVVVPPNWGVDVPSHWKSVDDRTMKKRWDRRIQELAAQSCEGYVAVKPRQSFYNSTRRKRQRPVEVSTSE